MGSNRGYLKVFHGLPPAAQYGNGNGNEKLKLKSARDGIGLRAPVLITDNG